MDRPHRHPTHRLAAAAVAADRPSAPPAPRPTSGAAPRKKVVTGPPRALVERRRQSRRAVWRDAREAGALNAGGDQRRLPPHSGLYAPGREAARRGDGGGRNRSPTKRNRAQRRRPKHRDPRRPPKAAPCAPDQQAQMMPCRAPDGATVPKIAEATGWRLHTVRGAIAGALKKRLGLTIASEKVDGRGRVYRVTP